MKQKTESRERAQNSFEIAGRNLSVLQAAKGMTDAEFAAALCVTKFTVRKWKNGKKIPAKKLGAAADFFGVNEESLRFDYSQTEGSVLDETFDQMTIIDPENGEQRPLETPEMKERRFCEYQRKVYAKERVALLFFMAIGIINLIFAVLFVRNGKITYTELVNGSFFLTFMLPVCALFCSFVQQLYRVLCKKLVVRRDYLFSELLATVFTAEFLIASALYGEGGTLFLVLVGAAAALRIVSFFLSCRRLSAVRSALFSVAAYILLYFAIGDDVNNFILGCLLCIAYYGLAFSVKAAAANEAALKFGNGFASLRPSKKKFVRHTAILLMCVLLLSGAAYGWRVCQVGILAKFYFDHLSDVQKKSAYTVADNLDDTKTRFAEGEYTLVKAKGFSVKIPKTIPYHSANNENIIYKNKSKDVVIVARTPVKLQTDFTKEYVINNSNRATYTPEKIELAKKEFTKFFGAYPVNLVELERIEYSHTPDDIQLTDSNQALLCSILLILKKGVDDYPAPQCTFFDRGEIHGEIKTPHSSSKKIVRYIRFYQTGSQEVYSFTVIVDSGDSAFQNVTKIINSITFTK